MVSSALTTTEGARSANAVVDTNAAPKIVASIESVVCSSFDDSEMPPKAIHAQLEKEDRNDSSILCLADNPCMDARNALLASDDIVRKDASTDDPSRTSPKAVDGTGGHFFDKLCVQPYDMLVRATSSAAHTEQSGGGTTKEVVIADNSADNDDGSIESTSVIAKMFDDLASLPSLASVGVTKFQEDSDSLLSQVEDLVFATEESAHVETITDRDHCISADIYSRL